MPSTLTSIAKNKKICEFRETIPRPPWSRMIQPSLLTPLLWMSVLRTLVIVEWFGDFECILTLVQDFYKKCRLPTGYQLEWDDAASRIRYAHLRTLLPLQKKLVGLSSRFPESLDAYHALYNNQDMQLKVARFLVAGNMKDAMLSDFGWAWRQVKPLIDVFDNDVSIFCALCSFRLHD